MYSDLTLIHQVIYDYLSEKIMKRYNLKVKDRVGPFLNPKSYSGLKIQVETVNDRYHKKIQVNLTHRSRISTCIVFVIRRDETNKL